MISNNNNNNSNTNSSFFFFLLLLTHSGSRYRLRLRWRCGSSVYVPHLARQSQNPCDIAFHIWSNYLPILYVIYCLSCFPAWKSYLHKPNQIDMVRVGPPRTHFLHPPWTESFCQSYNPKPCECYQILLLLGIYLYRFNVIKFAKIHKLHE